MRCAAVAGALVLIPAAAGAAPLRFILQQTDDHVPRASSPLVEDLMRADAFAASEHAASTVERRPTRKEAFEALLDGDADILVTPTIGEGAPELGTAWSKPLRKVDVIVVGKRGVPRPATLKALGAFHIARASSDLGPMLEAYLDEEKLPIEISAHGDIEDPSDLLGLIGAGAMPHGVVLRDELDDFLAYASGVEPWFVLRQVPMVWVIRADNEKLVKRLDAFLSRPQTAEEGGDLDAIKARGVVRVAMKNDPAAYYLDRDAPAGFQYDVALHLAGALGVRLEVVIPPDGTEPDALLADNTADLAAATKVPPAYATRKDAKKLRAWVDAFLEKESATVQRLSERYFGPAERPPETPPAVETGKPISRFDPIIQKYAARYGFAWKQVAAQMFVESAFRPDARSPCGALGLMQVMPRTGAEMGFSRLTDPDEGTHAGVKYMRKVIDRLGDLDEQERLRFAWASYNGGPGHIKDARLLARTLGLDPNRWHDHVARAVLMLEKKEHYAKAKYGYCRGTEVTAYVTRIERTHGKYAK